jgi:hypothetical protein
MRLTVDRAKELLNSYRYTSLGYRSWLNPVPCATGLMLIDALNGKRTFETLDTIRSDVSREMGEAGHSPYEACNIPMIIEGVTRKIADLAGVSHAYAIGLNNGFEGDSCQIHKCDEMNEPDYEIGLYDGVSLRPLTEEN